MRKKVILLVSILFVLLIAGCVKGEKRAENNDLVNEIAVKEQQTPEIMESQRQTAIIENKLNSMSLEQKVGQLFFLAYRKDSNGNPLTEINNESITQLTQIEPGGVVLFGENIDTEAQTSKLIADFQQQSTIPLFVGVDEEGGRVSRLHASGNIDSPIVPSATEMGKAIDSIDVYDYYKQIGSELNQLGFNVDFAPVADMNTNPKNTVIGDRAFGSDSTIVSKCVSQAVLGLQNEGVSATLKHFPGHGDTLTDSHTTQTSINHDRQRLLEVELLPFQEGIAIGVDFVMVGHIIAPNVTSDGLPSSMSKDMVQGLLRDELGYEGIVITDALDMGAIVNYYDSAEVAVKSIQSGVDMLLMPENAEKAYEALLDAVKSGQITEERLNVSVKRILALKYDKDLISDDEI